MVRNFTTSAVSASLFIWKVSGIPDRYEIQDGDVVNLDVSCMYDGFHGDLNETYLVGNVDEAGKRLVKNTRECLDLAIAAGEEEIMSQVHS